jgi:hypothetical protein
MLGEQRVDEDIRPQIRGSFSGGHDTLIKYAPCDTQGE